MKTLIITLVALLAFNYVAAKTCFVNPETVKQVIKK